MQGSRQGTVSTLRQMQQFSSYWSSGDMIQDTNERCDLALYRMRNY